MPERTKTFYFGTQDGLENENILYFGNNLKVLNKIKKDRTLRGNIKLIYIDPPFATRNHFFSKLGKKSYSDILTDEKYFSYLRDRIILMRDILSEDGSFYIHLDQRSVHYVKVMLDGIFGKNNFRNEIIWQYVSGGVPRRYFARKHDTILFYTKSDKYTFHIQKERRKEYSPNRIQKDDNGEFVWYIKPGCNADKPMGVKTYLDKYITDVWNIPIVNPMARERVDYPTRKPVELIERIISASTNPGDIVADFFAGSGTTGLAAYRLKRKFILCDNSPHAIRVIRERLKQAIVGY